MQVWWWGPAPQAPATDIARNVTTTPIRIGDTERDQAVSDLGDHFAAGRLSREEFDERADQAMQARFSSDLAPLFVDLPEPVRAQQARGPQQRPGGPPPWAYGLWLLPFVLLAGVAGAVLLNAPFLLWGLIWLAVILKVTGHRRRHQRQQLNPPGQR